ncbi:unnamed protein product [Adineta ricciae]|uniref:Uncharacterized protein n=1 Tax=Adineta ricciae TaxID=249248 RepID=A0A814ZY12_ADIRI|nr:unnamed protein product [Adineta ricciae]CAF1486464.1 unnamed protein product [Adineta ricciae]
MDKVQTCRSIPHLCSDIWSEIFQYFAVTDLYSTLKNISSTSDEVLFNGKYRNQLRGLTVDSHTTKLPNELPLDQVISLTIQDGISFDILQKCCCLRSLKLVGQFEWIIPLVTKCSQISMHLEQLSIVTPNIKLLHQLLSCILSFDSLRRLEICADEQEEKIEANNFPLFPSKIEHLILNLCPAITYGSLAYIQPGFINIRYLNISLFRHDRISVNLSNFPYLRSLQLSLLEPPFEEINRLVATMPNLVKLKLYGIVDDENFIYSHKWLHLLESTPSLLRIVMDVSFQETRSIFYNENLHKALHGINLSLICMIDDFDCYSYEERQQRWWQLEGVIRKNYCKTN